MRKFSAITQNALLLNLLVLLAASVTAVFPIWLHGIPNGADLPNHYQFATSFYDSLSHGIFYPSWSNLLNYGYGDVGIRFYPPFSYYVLVFFRFLAGNWFDGSCVTFVFWFFLGSAGIYFWSREWFSEKAALFAGLVYIFIPYHVGQIYNSFLYAEFAASAILPFCFLFVNRICRNGRAGDVLGLAFFYALLVLTHLPMTIIGSIALAIYSIFSLKKTNFFGSLARLFVSVAAGLLASSFYWTRMITELEFVNHNNARFISFEYDFHRNFVLSGLSQLIYEADKFQLRLVDSVFLITVGIIAPCVIVYFVGWKANRRFELANVSATLVSAVLMCVPLSLPIWETFSVLQKTQFPWRWMAVVSMCGAIFAAAGFRLLFEYFPTGKRPLVILTIGLMLVGSAFTFIRVMRPLIQNPKTDFNQITERLKITRTNDAWWTVWATGEAMGRPVSPRQAETLSSRPGERIIRFSAGDGPAAPARLNLFYYPHWKAFAADDREIEIGKNEDGSTLLYLPAEETTVKLVFIEPAFVRAAYLISLTAWLVFLCAAAFLLLKNPKATRPAPAD